MVIFPIRVRVQDFLAKYLRKGYYILSNIIQNVYFTFYKYISSIYQAYLKLISDIHTSYPRYILGRSHVFLNHISSIHFKLILIISQANLNRMSGLEPVSGLFRTSLRYISVIKPYLMHFWRISLLSILVSKPCFAVLVPTRIMMYSLVYISPKTDSNCTLYIQGGMKIRVHGGKKGQTLF